MVERQGEKAVNNILTSRDSDREVFSRSLESCYLFWPKIGLTEPKVSWTMFVQPLCSQKLGVFVLGIFLGVSRAFIIENVSHANKNEKETAEWHWVI